MTQTVLPAAAGTDAWRYALSRTAQSAFVLWAAYTVSFVILYILPSDPVSIMLNQGDASLVDPAQVAALRAQYHLDEPLVVQYGIALWQALRLDLGVSIQTGQPVSAMLAQAAPATAALALSALAAALVLGLGLALAASSTRHPRLRSALQAAPSLGVCLPTFWVGLLLLQWLSFTLPVFPAMGNEGWQSLVLPAATLALPTAATVAQVLSRSLSAVWGQPFVAALRAKGLSRRRLLFTHVLPNATIPVLTMTGVLMGNLLAGSVVTETVFSREGIGRLAQGAVAVKDIPVVQGVVVLAAAVFVIVNLVVDLAYPLLDPRITRNRARALA
ncbi:Nickel transport system permease protein NikB [Achromobacter deleyi]|uniref:Nickel transport system permease protein NikB n=1 Tax=Achromobacter deleyi TaxID=1353891 RepID=A0A6S7B0V3_9BURK|nr:ABC transporter permease [Achromobacter deleyi]CAB3743617.1 Nickel transport system permease protein NikB [Achromobacter deleyi]CAB3927422.1 Nickel transport system permease protein NikB [Achromobacter deleyi]CAB3927695.1 Nickel transport system permease protein NikB [Achromobacter deleyi]